MSKPKPLFAVNNPFKETMQDVNLGPGSDTPIPPNLDKTSSMNSEKDPNDPFADDPPLLEGKCRILLNSKFEFS